MSKKKRLTDHTMRDGSALTGSLMRLSERNQNNALMDKVDDVRDMIAEHMNQIHRNITRNAQDTIEYVQQLQKKTAAASKRKPKASTNDKHEQNDKNNNDLAGLMEVWKMLKVPPLSAGKTRIESIEVLEFV